MIDRRRRGKSGEARTPANYVDRGREKGDAERRKKRHMARSQSLFTQAQFTGGKLLSGRSRGEIGGAEAFMRVFGQRGAKGFVG